MKHVSLIGLLFSLGDYAHGELTGEGWNLNFQIMLIEKKIGTMCSDTVLLLR